jgi:hypothetical protein
MSDQPNRPVVDGDVADPGTVFQGLAEVLYASDEPFDVYDAVCAAAPLFVTGCDHASLMLMRNGHPITAGSGDEVARAIDSMERELGEGPCLDAIIDESAYIDADLTEGSPWPGLAERVLDETPVRGMAGFRLLLEDRKAGALNLFSDTPGRLNTESVNEGILLASFVSVALTAAAERQTARSLRDGLESNREIGKAIGLMMAFHKITDEEAFAMLRKASQEMNLKLSHVAREVVQHHNKRG